MGLDPTKPEMTLLLVMLHTGTMLAVIVFFWNSWKANFFTSQKVFLESVKFIIIATIATGFVGLLLKVLIEKILLKGVSHPEVELLFGNLPLISAALAAVGALILWAGYKEGPSSKEKTTLGLKAACLIGMVQGICLPFRGFSRSGATISTGLILGIEKRRVEDFSFALAVILTPPVILREALRFLKAQHASCTPWDKYDRLVFTEHDRHGIEFYCRDLGPSMAVQLAGARPLVFIWYLLFMRFSSHFFPALPGLIVKSSLRGYSSMEDVMRFSDLNESQLLALAITAEEEDGRIYRDFAQELRKNFPATAELFDRMADEESGHRHRLIELYQKKFGEHIPLVRRQDVTGFYGFAFFVAVAHAASRKSAGTGRFNGSGCAKIL